MWTFEYRLKRDVSWTTYGKEYELRGDAALVAARFMSDWSFHGEMVETRLKQL